MKNKAVLDKTEMERVYQDTSKNHSPLLFSYFYNPIAFWISTRILLNTSLTPNQLTMIGLILAVIASFLMATGRYPYLIAAALLLQIVYIFDCMDGEIARLKKMCSNFGAWLDGTTDLFKMVLYYFALGMGYYQQSGKVEAWFLVSLLVSSRFLLNSIIKGIEQIFGQQVYKAIDSAKIYSIGARFGIEPQFLTFSDDIKYFLISLGVILGQLKLTMIIFIFIHFSLWLLAIFKTGMTKYKEKEEG